MFALLAQIITSQQRRTPSIPIVLRTASYATAEAAGSANAQGENLSTFIPVEGSCTAGYAAGKLLVGQF